MGYSALSFLQQIETQKCSGSVKNLVLVLLFWEQTGMYDWSSVTLFLQLFT
jgi:hypothetical protein